MIAVRVFTTLVGWMCGALPPVCVPPQPVEWRDPSPHAVRFVDVEPGVRLEVLDWGGRGRAVVLLAGSGLSAHIYDDFAPRLAEHAHVYGITRRGYGRSSRPDAGYDNQRLADDVVAVADALNLNRPVLAGHSMAGGEITTVAKQHGERIGGLVYIDALRDPRDPQDPAVDPSHAELLKKLPPGPAPISDDESKSFAGYRAWQLRSMRFSFPEAALRASFDATPDGSMGAFNTPGRIGRALGDGDVARDYSGIHVPVLALIDYPKWDSDAWRYDRQLFRPGDLPVQNDEQRAAMKAFSDLIGRSVDRSVAKLKAGVPGATIVDLPGAGHYMFLTREWDVVFEVDRFIKRLDAP